MGAATDTKDDGAASYSGRTYSKSKRGGSTLLQLPPEEARVRAIAEVVNGLIQAVQEGRDVDLNELKTQVNRLDCIVCQRCMGLSCCCDMPLPQPTMQCCC